MKKLILSSAGFRNPKVKAEFFKLAGKKPETIRILFIPTASRYEGELKYVESDKKNFLDSGIRKENIITFDSEKPLVDKDLKNIDVVWVCGGNTFYLLKKMRETGMDKKITELVNNGALYFGVSAGSLLAGPDIAMAEPFDENDVHLQDFTALSLTKTSVSPHYNQKEKSVVDSLVKKLAPRFKVIPLTDEQALEVLDDKEMVIE